MAHGGQKLAFGLGGRLGRFLGGDQGQFCFFAGRDVIDGAGGANGCAFLVAQDGGPDFGPAHMRVLCDEARFDTGAVDIQLQHWQQMVQRQLQVVRMDEAGAGASQ
jgi:hypothetical protein